MKNKIYEGFKINNFRELVNLYKEKYSDNIAFEYKKSPSDKEIIQVKYHEFAEHIENLGTFLLHNKSKRVAVIGHNRYEWFVTYLAATTAGLIIIPLDKSLPDDEIKGLLKRSKADTIFYDNKYEVAIADYKKDIDPTIKNICFDNDYYNDLIENSAKLYHTNYSNVTIKEDEMSIMLFTSGTTAISKAVMLSQHAICMNLYSLSQMIEITPKDKFLSFLPLHHTFESTTTFLFGTSCGITIAICDGLRYISKNMAEYKVTGFVCVPLMLEIMYKRIYKIINEQKRTRAVNFLRKFFRHFPISIRRRVFRSIIDSLGGNLITIIAGGAKMDKETLQGYRDFGFHIHQGYGLTETSPVLAGENCFYTRAGSIGFPLPGVEIKIDNPDKDGIGEIIAKTPSLMLGYYEDEEKTKEVIKDGYFYTGDLGYIDKDGFIFITGRKKDMIVLKNGKKIFPEELEILINNLSYVTESMVFGHVDNTKVDRNEDVVLCAKIVYNADELKKVAGDVKDVHEYILEDIKENINKQMPAYKYIRHIIVTTDELIKTTTHKIKRNEEMKLISKELEELNKQ